MSEPVTVLDTLIIMASEESDRPATADSLLVQELGLDSLALVSLSMRIETQWPSVAPLDYDPATMYTVSDIAKIVQGRLREMAEHAN